MFYRVECGAFNFEMFMGGRDDRFDSAFTGPISAFSRALINDTENYTLVPLTLIISLSQLLRYSFKRSCRSFVSFEINEKKTIVGWTL